MTIKDKMLRDIECVKLALIKKAKVKGIYENFGIKEINNLQDKYGYTQEIHNFADWCANFDIDELNNCK